MSSTFDTAVLLLCWTGVASASLTGMEEVVLEGQNACKGLGTSASLFRHTLSELDASLDDLRLREAWAGDTPPNGVSRLSFV